MAHRIVQQDNGKLALWSSVSGELLLWNATPQQIVDFELAQEVEGRLGALETWVQTGKRWSPEEIARSSPDPEAVRCSLESPYPCPVVNEDTRYVDADVFQQDPTPWIEAGRNGAVVHVYTNGECSLTLGQHRGLDIEIAEQEETVFQCRIPVNRKEAWEAMLMRGREPVWAEIEANARYEMRLELALVLSEGRFDSGRFRHTLEGRTFVWDGGVRLAQLAEIIALAAQGAQKRALVIRWEGS